MRLGVIALSALLFGVSAPHSLAAPDEDAATVPVIASDDFLSDSDTPDSNPRVRELIAEAQMLFYDRRPIDARAKLLEALRADPRDYRPHKFLGYYYLAEVGNFQLADRYLETAYMLFKEKFGPDEVAAVNSKSRVEHAVLLKWLTESRVNLDDYEGALKLLDRFSQFHMNDWYSGSRAWVLFKLKRIDEGIKVAQAGLMRGDDLGRTFNILGILFSVKGQTELSLDAFAKSARFELAFGSGQAATPLNNAGEVYREMFQDSLAEAAWRRAIQFPDGCEHILPSLNLVLLYIDQLRLFQAERVLSDFEGCFAKHSIRSDTEHRSLLALARGRIALHRGDFDRAVSLLTLAGERQQWFGKIGTDEADLRFAASGALSTALKARANALRDRVGIERWEGVNAVLQRNVALWRSSWLARRAVEIGVDELNDLEDLSVRNTDSMLEYPTLGEILASASSRAVNRRLARLKESDQRPEAVLLYELYQAQSELENGDEADAEARFQKVLERLRPIDGLAKAEALAGLLAARTNGASWFWPESKESQIERVRWTEQLFDILPSKIRAIDGALPVSLDAPDGDKHVSRIQKKLFTRRFFVPDADISAEPRYRLVLRADPKENSSHIEYTLILLDRGQQIVRVDEEVETDSKEEAALLNRFISEVFSARRDGPAEPLEKLDRFFEGMLDE